MTAPIPGSPASGNPGSLDNPGSHDTTGHAGVDAALRSLEGLESRPLDDHLEALTTVHEQLHTTLDEHRNSDDDDPAADTSVAPRHP